MVERHTDFEIQCEFPAGTEYVLSADCATIEAERDEWKRKYDEAMAKLATEWHESNGCVDHWERSKKYLARALAIAEGRDNG